jgi:hypothetical protein
MIHQSFNPPAPSTNTNTSTVTYPATNPELCLPELEGKTAKMYRGGKICLVGESAVGGGGGVFFFLVST